jgi:hypothetical protein
MADTGPDRCAVITVAIADYDDGAVPVTPVHDAGAAFASLFEGPGGVGDNVARNRLVGPRAEESSVRAEIKAWGSAQADVGLLLWTGHCERDSVQGPQVHVSNTKVAAVTLAGWLADQRFRRWVVIVDGCFAGSVVDALYPLLNRAAVGPDQSCLLLGSADDTSPADAGIFTTALAKVLAQGPEQGWWATADRFLVVGKVIERLDEELVGIDPALVGTVPRAGGRRWSGRVFPNPRYRPRSAAVALDEAHFLPKSRGIDTGEVGWYFTGRTQVLGRIVDWLGQPGNGLFVVTGPAGTGKSAVLGRVVTLSVPEYRRMAEAAGVLERAPAGTVPPEGVVTAAFHAREKRLDQLVGFLGHALGLGELDRASLLVDGVEARASPVVIVVDALDEAATNHARPMVDQVLAPLGALAGVKVLVGTRPGVAHWGEDVKAPVAAVADLAFEPGTEVDIASFATERLLALRPSSYAGCPQLARAVAGGVAARALSDPRPDGARVGSFLVARVLTRTLAGQRAVELSPGWEQRLPSGFAEAFEADLATYAARLGPDAERTIRDLLEALAWDEGSGLPRGLIPTVAAAVTGRAYSDDDVAMCLREAAGHLLEAEEQGWAVYRLYHERLREHLRATTRAREAAAAADADAAVHARIADALIDLGLAGGWADIDPYLAASLPAHARIGGRIERLATAAGFLEHAQPAAMLAALPLSGDGAPGAHIRTYRRASHALTRRRPDERRLALELAAARAAEDEFGSAHGPLSPRWVRGPLDRALQTLVGHTSWVRAVAVGTVGGRAVAVSGGGDGTVRVWDLARGEAVGPALKGHTGSVQAVAVGAVEGRAVAVSGGGDGTVRVWDLARGEAVGPALKGHTSWVRAVAVGTVGGRAVAVSGGDDRTVRVWDLARGEAVGPALKGHTASVEAVAVGTVGGRAVAVSGGGGTLRVWDLARGEAVGPALKGHTASVEAVAVGTVGGRAVAVSGGDDHTVRVWDLARGEAVGPALKGHTASVEAVAVGTVGGRAVAVSGGDDSTVGVWDLARGACIMTLPALAPVGALTVIPGGVLVGAGSYVNCIEVAGLGPLPPDPTSAMGASEATRPLRWRRGARRRGPRP